MSVSFHIRLPDPATARGADPALSFSANGADAFAEQLQDALREPRLFEHWRAGQPDPDAVDPSLGATDPDARVSGSQHDLHIDLIATTVLPGELLRQRLKLLAGNAWELRNVS